LTDAELKIVRALRDIPEGVAREELIRLIDDLMNFVADPRCPHAQADGVPCPSLGTACEQCQVVAETLGSVRRHFYQLYLIG
jgi:hypothetical protein